MEFLYLLESIRNPVFDFFFSLITTLGEETFFLVIALTFFWCIDKREGYYILTTGLVGTVINQGLKLMFRIPRPWILDPNFNAIESAKPAATGYSFPSGHTQNIAGTFGSIGLWTKKNSVRIVSLSIIVLVAFSRMYLGVHTPLDVCVSLGIAAILVIVFHHFFASEERFNKTMPYIIAVCCVISLALLIFVFSLPTDSFDKEGLVNLESGMKNSATLFGCMLGLILVYTLDRLVIKIETGARWYMQVIKLAIGLLIVLAIKSGLKAPLEAFVGLFTDTPEYIARAIRYFIIVAVAGSVYPLSFKFFEKARIPFMEKFTEWLTSKFNTECHQSENK